MNVADKHVRIRNSLLKIERDEERKKKRQVSWRLIVNVFLSLPVYAMMVFDAFGGRRVVKSPLLQMIRVNFFVRGIVACLRLLWRAFFFLARFIVKVGRGLLTIVVLIVGGADSVLGKVLSRIDKMFGKTDVFLDRILKISTEVYKTTVLSSEVLEKRIPITFQEGEIPEVNVKISGKEYSFAVLDMNVFEAMDENSPMDIEIFFSRLHKECVPFSIISLLEYTWGDITKHVRWVKDRFEQRRSYWEQPKFDQSFPDWWMGQFDWLIDQVVHSHVEWKNYIVLPLDLLSNIEKRRLAGLQPAMGSISQIELEELVYKLFHPLSDFDERSLRRYERFRDKIGENSGEIWSTLLPEGMSVFEEGIKMSSGEHVAFVDILSLGCDFISYTPEGEMEPRSEVKIRNLPWLQDLLISLMTDRQSDQQIWVRTSTVGVQKQEQFISSLSRQLQSLQKDPDFCGDEETGLQPKEEKYLYYRTLEEVYSRLTNQPNMLPYQMSYRIMVKAGSEDSLLDLKDRVKLFLELEGVNVWYWEPETENENFLALQEFLPIIWPRETREELDRKVRTTIPMPQPDLRDFFVKEKLVIPEKGPIVGSMVGGLEVIGPAHKIISGTTGAGKSTFLKQCVMNFYPLYAGIMQLFVLDFTGQFGDENSMLGWYTMFQKFKGYVILPQNFDSPEAMIIELKQMDDQMAFYYRPDFGLPNIVEFDLAVIDFVMARMSRSYNLGAERSWVIFDNCERIMDKPDGLQARKLVYELMPQGQEFNTTVFLSIRSLVDTRKYFNAYGTLLNSIHEYYLFWDPTPSNLPWSMGIEPTTSEAALLSKDIVQKMVAMRPMGVFSELQESVGKHIIVSGFSAFYGKVIVSPQTQDVIDRKPRGSDIP